MGTDKHLEGLREQRLQEVREGVPGSSARWVPRQPQTRRRKAGLQSLSERRKDGKTDARSPAELAKAGGEAQGPFSQSCPWALGRPRRLPF